ncbi:MAG TPA: FHA domain-containing protein [Polyangiaceae bacterium]|nr:FHA domain-containing protein [Polyangiaceae bacterium]
MRCDRCGAENPANLIFCRDCGTRLPETQSGTEARGALRPAAPNFDFSAKPPHVSMSGNACGRCGTTNPAANRFCSSCGAALAADASRGPPGAESTQASAQAAPPPPRAQAVCPRCRGVNGASMQFCQFCGSSLDPAAPAPPRPPSGIVRPLPSATSVAPPPPPDPFGHPALAQPPAEPRRTNLRLPAARLVVITQDGTPGRTYDIREIQVDIGREEGGILLPNDPYVSPRHARLRRQNSAFFVRDLSSINGVYLRLRRPEKVHHGDLVLAGLEVLRFEVVSDAEKALGPAMDRGTQLFGSPATARYARLCQRTIEGVTRDIYSLHRDETIIGRESGDIVFTSDPFMSRQHAAISRDPYDGTVVLRDLGSSNGTYLAIRGEVPLESGDHLRIGQHLFRLDVDPE